jgi:2-polyprenyl-3-methyl-5-hydroxy-6-metoxy-1,4-benzoquinol methylase
MHRDRTIAQFGEQWNAFSDDAGYFGSSELLADFISPFNLSEFKGARVGDLGAGGGRFSILLAACGAREVVAIEPSSAVETMKRKISERGLSDRISILNIPATEIPASLQLDYIISIGVVHHIADPRPAVEAAIKALRPGGRLIVWLYAKEGNELYLMIAVPLRVICRILPLKWKSAMAFLLDLALVPYIHVCRLLPRMPLPLSSYMRDVLGKLDGKRRRLVIYDQLNPDYAMYYTEADVRALFAGLGSLELHWRRKYSWLAFLTKHGEKT